MSVNHLINDEEKLFTANKYLPLKNEEEFNTWVEDKL